MDNVSLVRQTAGQLHHRVSIGDRTSLCSGKQAAKPHVIVYGCCKRLTKHDMQDRICCVVITEWNTGF
jgi:hypothetical protein